MRLNLEGSVVGLSTTLLSVTGIIDWSTISQFRAALSRCVACPEPDVLLDLTGLLSWSHEAQVLLEHATEQARLHGGRVVVFGLAPIPRWEATGTGLPGLEFRS